MLYYLLFVSTIVITKTHKFEVIDDVGTVTFCRLRPSGPASAHLAGGGAPPLLFAPPPIRKLDTPPLPPDI